MAVSQILQQPNFTTLPVGQEVIFVVANDDAVAFQKKVKFRAEVHIGTSPPNLSTSTKLIGTFKTTPNNAGVGIFDLRTIIENYVSADNMAGNNSKYKDTATTDTQRHPLHIVDKFSISDNIVRYLAIQFSVEFLGATDSAGNQDDNIVRQAVGTSANSDGFTLFNGYLKYTDKLVSELNSDDFGFDLEDFEAAATFPTVNTRKFLTNAPTQLNANIEDYGTIGILQTSSTLWDNARDVKFTYYSSTGASLGNDTYSKSSANGAFFGYSSDYRKQILYVGVYPANLRNWSSTFQALVTAGTIQGGNYTVEIRNSSGVNVYQTYTVNVNCPNEKQYESVRLCWLNQWGAWDYYTFTLKSIRTINTSGSEYTQLQGSWNARKYYVDGYKGGKKAFRRNAKEKISINTDYVTPDNNVLFEELMNSPEVYLLDGFQTDVSYAVLNNYVTPVRITNKSFTKKTIANNKLIQYKFEIEKSLTFRTQTV